jgi:hypothetical protein
MKTTLLILTAITTLTFLTGCVAVHKVHYKDATRTDVRFESLEASSTFYDALLAKKFPPPGKDSRILLGQTLYTSETRHSANVVFNTAAAVADLNQDAIISDSEAHSFAATKGETPNSKPQAPDGQ